MPRKKGFDFSDRFNRLTLAIWLALTIALAVGLHRYEVKSTDYSHLTPLEFKQQLDAHKVDYYSPVRVITYTAFGSLVIFMVLNAAMGSVRKIASRKGKIA
jgi:hypothetical protein